MASLIVQQERLVRVLHELVEAKHSLEIVQQPPTQTFWQTTTVRCISRVLKLSDRCGSTALYGSTTVSETFGLGITENVSMMRSGYSSRGILGLP